MPKPMLDKHAFALLIDRCKNAELNDQIMLLQEINANLPKSQQLQIPSLITGDYVRRALDIIEEIIDSSAPRN